MSHPIHSHSKGETGKPAPTFSKVFRWQPEQTSGPMPVRVEVAGSFNGWQRATMKRDRVSGLWQVTLHNIPANRTHKYMLLVNGRPVKDPHADGLAVPHTPEEVQHQLVTPRGSRVFMLASQTK
ncbi:MAG: hypothetical protein WCH99_05760 [Verrucomicrobiota bacterium]